MKFEGLQAQFSRLQQLAAWRLLKATNAPQILAFLEDLFSEEKEVSFARAKVALEATLERANESGLWETEMTASAYLRQWSEYGWLRDLDDMVSMTDASEQALRFAKSLDQRALSTSASHLRIVQDNVRDLAIRLSTNPDERIQRLQKQIEDLRLEIENVQAGYMYELTETQKREALRELYYQASVLSGDFRRVEDDMRHMDQKIREEMIQGTSTRGLILEEALDYENLLQQTESGSAFFGFHQMLQDENRSMEFRHELNNVLNSGGNLLSRTQFQSLKNLMRDLNRESDRVIEVRRRHSQGLRAYIESGAAQESRAVNRLISELEKCAIALRDRGVLVSTKLGISLKVGKAAAYTPTALKLKSPEDAISTEGVEEQVVEGGLSNAMLDAIQTVQTRKIAEEVFQLVETEGPLTIAQLTDCKPITKGLEELTALVRVARAVGATELDGKDTINFNDHGGTELRASLPRLLISSELFPSRLEDLKL